MPCVRRSDPAGLPAGIPRRPVAVVGYAAVAALPAGVTPLLSASPHSCVEVAHGELYPSIHGPSVTEEARHEHAWNESSSAPSTDGRRALSPSQDCCRAPAADGADGLRVTSGEAPLTVPLSVRVAVLPEHRGRPSAVPANAHAAPAESGVGTVGGHGAKEAHDARRATVTLLGALVDGPLHLALDAPDSVPRYGVADGLQRGCAESGTLRIRTERADEPQEFVSVYCHAQPQSR